MITILLSRPGWLKTDSAEVDLFLRYDLRGLRLFRLKRYLLSIKIKVTKKIEYTTPARQFILLKVRRFLRLATPPLKGGETYIVIFLIITAVFVIKIFLRSLTAMRFKRERDTEDAQNLQRSNFLTLCNCAFSV